MKALENLAEKHPDIVAAKCRELGFLPGSVRSKEMLEKTLRRELEPQVAKAIRPDVKKEVAKEYLNYSLMRNKELVEEARGHEAASRAIREKAREFSGRLRQREAGLDDKQREIELQKETVDRWENEYRKNRKLFGEFKQAVAREVERQRQHDKDAYLESIQGIDKQLLKELELEAVTGEIELLRPLYKEDFWNLIEKPGGSFHRLAPGRYPYWEIGVKEQEKVAQLHYTPETEPIREHYLVVKALAKSLRDCLDELGERKK